MQYQAALQLSQQAPQMYNLPELHRQMLDVLGIKDADKIVPVPGDMKPRDPVSENMDVINGKPVKAFMYQDHDAHMQVHMAIVQDPKVQNMVQESPMAGAMQAAMAAHLQEHLAFKYRAEIEKELGVELPPPSEPLPEDIEVRLSRLVAEAADRLLNRDRMEEQQREAQEKLEDPVIQMQQKRLELEQMEIQRKAAADQQKIFSSMAQAEMRQETELERISTQADIEGARIGASIAKDKDSAEARDSETSEKVALDKARLAADVAKILIESDEGAKE